MNEDEIRFEKINTIDNMIGELKKAISQGANEDTIERLHNSINEYIVSSKKEIGELDFEIYSRKLNNVYYVFCKNKFAKKDAELSNMKFNSIEEMFNYCFDYYGDESDEIQYQTYHNPDAPRSVDPDLGIRKR